MRFLRNPSNTLFNLNNSQSPDTGKHKLPPGTTPKTNGHGTVSGACYTASETHQVRPSSRPQVIALRAQKQQAGGPRPPQNSARKSGQEQSAGKLHFPLSCCGFACASDSTPIGACGPQTAYAVWLPCQANKNRMSFRSEHLFGFAQRPPGGRSGLEQGVGSPFPFRGSKPLF